MKYNYVVILLLCHLTSLTHPGQCIQYPVVKRSIPAYCTVVHAYRVTMFPCPCRVNILEVVFTVEEFTVLVTPGELKCYTYCTLAMNRIVYINLQS